MIDGKIQAFPWPYWQSEFGLAAEAGLGVMEWTLDQERIFENPLMQPAGRTEILALSREHGIAVPSLTGDFCMQAPFWKATGATQAELLRIFERVLLSCAALEIKIIVLPLVDNGAIHTQAQRRALIAGTQEFQPLLAQYGMVIAFESDFPPPDLAVFIADFSSAEFGINYDIGNSAGLGWDVAQEIPLLAPRIVNVHVKDRMPGGGTVPLGQGAADLPLALRLLGQAGYRGNFILQTARAADDAHMAVLKSYRNLVANLIGGEVGA